MELTTTQRSVQRAKALFMMSKIQNLNGTHNVATAQTEEKALFMMSKIQNLNGTHNIYFVILHRDLVVYDVKDTKFEWNSQPIQRCKSGGDCCL